MPWWAWLIIAFVVIAIVGAVVNAFKEVVGNILLTIVLWILAFPIMLIVTIVKGCKGDKNGKEQNKKEKAGAAKRRKK